MIYQLSNKNLTPILEIVEKRNDFLVNKNIYQMFTDYNFHRVSSSEQLSKLFPALIESFEILKSQDEREDDKGVLHKLFLKYELNTEFLYGLSISKLKKLLLEEGDNLKKINSKNLSKIKDVVYRNVDSLSNVINIGIVGGNLDFKSSDDYWMFQSLLLSQKNQSIFIEKMNDKLNLYGEVESISIMGDGLENYLDESVLKISSENINHSSVLDKPLNMELFTSVINRYLSEETDLQKFTTLGEKVVFLNQTINDVNAKDVLFQLASTLREGGYAIFKDPELVKSYVDIVIKSKKMDSRVEVNYFLENKINQVPPLPLYVHMPLFSENSYVRKNLIEAVSPESFFELAVSISPETFVKNVSAKNLESLANNLIARILKAAEKSTKPKDGYLQPVDGFKSGKARFAHKEHKDNIYEWYLSTILMECGIKSSEYWEQLRKYLVIDKNHPSRLNLDEYSYVHEHVRIAFDVISQGLDILSLLQNKKPISIQQLENFIKINPIELKSREDNEVQLGVAEVSNSLQYYLSEKDVKNSIILNVNMQKYFLVETKQSYAKNNFDYKSVAQYFLSGSDKPYHDLFLGLESYLLLENNKLEKNREMLNYIKLFAEMVNNGEFTFNGETIKSNEQLIEQLFMNGNSKQKEAAFVLYHVYPKMINFETDEITLDRNLFKSLFKKYKGELENNKSLLGATDKVLDTSEDGKLILNNENIEIFRLLLNDDSMLDYISFNKNFLINEEVLKICILEARESCTDYFISCLWEKVYLEIGHDFFNEMCLKKMDESIRDDVSLKGMNSKDWVAVKSQNLSIKAEDLVSFMLRGNNNFKKLGIDKDVLFDEKLVEVFHKQTNHLNKSWVSKIPSDYYRHPNALSLLGLMSTGIVEQKNLLESIPKEILLTPKNILLVLKNSRNKLEALNMLSPELFDYCVTNKVGESDVLEKMEIIFNTMVMDSITRSNPEPSVKKSFKF